MPEIKQLPSPRLAKWTHHIKRSALQEMLKEASRPEVISFALGLPAPELFPASEYSKAFEKVLISNPKALQYGPPSIKLKDHIVKLMKVRGIDCTHEQIFITAGAQQGMSLLARLLLDPGTQILTEELTYTGFMQVVEPYEPEILTVPTDLVKGLDVDALSLLLRRGARPSFIYCMTDGHNPLGVSMELDRRKRLLEVIRQYKVPIIEDDAYGFLQYDHELMPPLRSMENRLVFYIGSFSKIIGPSLRVGWIIVPESLITPLSIIKEASDIDTITISQHAIVSYLDSENLDAHILKLRKEYSLRRDVMLNMLEQYFPKGIRLNRPASGVFIWVELPDCINTNLLLEKAIKAGVAFIPGDAFNIKNKAMTTHSLRLNFSNNAPRDIEEGIKRLAQVIRESIAVRSSVT